MFWYFLMHMRLPRVFYFLMHIRIPRVLAFLDAYASTSFFSIHKGPGNYYSKICPKCDNKRLFKPLRSDNLRSSFVFFVIFPYLLMTLDPTLLCV